ncbi:hypothetical protein BDV39DRAFT_178419 [Aspergillus sergii]|uniref:Uncharacterized protein n=1 Tax=Aspergillus sergii TaxID=1034303 RepID=A0A5N6X0C4_9EURO|nr:hypothetical protein BDV39DRAFT_178419 [Aspergillus sergii]
MFHTNETQVKLCISYKENSRRPVRFNILTTRTADPFTRLMDYAMSAMSMLCCLLGGLLFVLVLYFILSFSVLILWYSIFI